MRHRIDELLRLLRDVNGVTGGFVWGKSGALLGRDLPSRFDDDSLAEVGQRIARIYEAFQGAGDELDTATLTFGGSKLHLREVDTAFIAVLSRPQVNEPALKMALNVLGRAVYAELERRPAQSTPPLHAAARVPPAQRTAPTTPATGGIAPLLRSSAVSVPRAPDAAYELRSRLLRGKRASE
jgi:hypothetical protein